MTIYIEGDGASWLLKTIPPRNPTPSQSLVAAMAAEDQNQFVMYLARPCQFIAVQTIKECDESMWTDGRFSTQVIAMSNQAIDRALLNLPTVRLNLVGHSGGGTLATLIAAQRSDVNCLVTMASPLDITAWARALSIAPLTRSQNPAKPNANLQQIRQTHFLGENDRIVTKESIGEYRNFPRDAQFMTISGFDHRRYWADQWPLLQTKSCLQQPRG
jgi:pimeloyl-ACP methyl ester carboxylesterase